MQQIWKPSVAGDLQFLILFSFFFFFPRWTKEEKVPTQEAGLSGKREE